MGTAAAGVAAVGTAARTPGTPQTTAPRRAGAAAGRQAGGRREGGYTCIRRRRFCHDRRPVNQSSKTPYLVSDLRIASFVDAIASVDMINWIDAIEDAIHRKGATRTAGDDVDVSAGFLPLVDIIGKYREVFEKMSTPYPTALTNSVERPQKYNRRDVPSSTPLPRARVAQIQKNCTYSERSSFKYIKEGYHICQGLEASAPNGPRPTSPSRRCPTAGIQRPFCRLDPRISGARKDLYLVNSSLHPLCRNQARADRDPSLVGPTLPARMLVLAPFSSRRLRDAAFHELLSCFQSASLRRATTNNSLLLPLGAALAPLLFLPAATPDILYASTVRCARRGPGAHAGHAADLVSCGCRVQHDGRDGAVRYAHVRGAAVHRQEGQTRPSWLAPWPRLQDGPLRPLLASDLRHAPLPASAKAGRALSSVRWASSAETSSTTSLMSTQSEKEGVVCWSRSFSDRLG